MKRKLLRELIVKQDPVCNQNTCPLVSESKTGHLQTQNLLNLLEVFSSLKSEEKLKSSIHTHTHTRYRLIVIFISSANQLIARRYEGCIVKSFVLDYEN